MPKAANALLPRSAPSSYLKKGFLRRRGDYLATYKGIASRARLLVVYVKPNSLNALRFGVTVPKTTGTAVMRNRIKRWCKEFYRRVDISSFGRGADINVVVANKRLKHEDYRNIEYVQFYNQLEQNFFAALGRLK